MKTTKPQLTETEKDDLVQRELRYFNITFSQKYNAMVKSIALRLDISIEDAEQKIENAMKLS